MKRKVLLGTVVLLVAVAGLTLWRLGDLDLGHRDNRPFEVMSNGEILAGTVWMPDSEPVALVAFVHGDGPQDRVSGGGYAPMINSFLDQGIAVASWDKPGVGQSSGNWLHQTMADRTEETRQVLQGLRVRFPGIAKGALGFSQAGWVLPALQEEDADFLIFIGAAVSWSDQGAYYTRRRLAGEGVDGATIEAVLQEQARQDAYAFGPGATVANAPVGMSPDRWWFVRANRRADARGALARQDLPVLAVWGAADLNVEPGWNARVFQELLGDSHPANKVVEWPDATHSLLKSAAYNWQLTENWSGFAKIRFLVEGRYAYAPGALDEITDWISSIAMAE